MLKHKKKTHATIIKRHRRYKNDVSSDITDLRLVLVDWLAGYCHQDSNLKKKIIEVSKYITQRYYSLWGYQWTNISFTMVNCSMCLTDKYIRRQKLDCYNIISRSEKNIKHK